MKRIKEEKVKDILKIFNNRNLKIEINGILNQEYFMKKAKIVFLDNDMEIRVNDNKNCITLKLSYIEEIYLLEKNKLKFLTNNDLEILILLL